MNPTPLTAPRLGAGNYLLAALSPGPVSEADTSQGVDTYGWCLWADNGGLHLQQAGQIALDPNAPAPSFLANWPAGGLERISLAFDQNARRVVALTQNGQITLSYLTPGGGSGAVENRVTWPGHDALLFWDGLLRDYRSGEPTDVAIYYLSPDRTQLCYRIQLESYATEHVLETLPGPCSFDAIACSGTSVVFYLAQPGGVYPAFESDPYPAYVKDGMRLEAALIAGVWQELIVQRDPTAEGLLLTPALQSGQFVQVIVVANNVLEGLLLTPALQSGQFVQVIVQADNVLEGLLLAPALNAGLFTITVVQGGTVAEGLLLTPALQAGTYTG